MQMPLYFDYMATTPVDPRVADVMQQCLTLDGIFGNPASRSHVYGWKAEQMVESSRRLVAQLVNADPREIVWTSGATEADNLAIKGAAHANAHKGRHLITSAIEHSAVLDSCKQLETEGFEVSYLLPDARGLISADSVANVLREDTILVSIMHANNEVGSINDIAAISAVLRQAGVLFHCDAAQSVGKVSVDVEALGVDLLSLSSHKFYGPKGMGALYVRRRPRVLIEAQIHGGGHERGMRSGTLATHQIAGLGHAAKIAAAEVVDESKRLQRLRDRLWLGVSQLDGVSLNGHPQQRLPGALNLSVAGIDGETLMASLKDLALSTGSACHSASLEPSHVLTAMGLSDEAANSSLRFSLGRFTTEADVDHAVAHFCYALTKLREA